MILMNDFTAEPAAMREALCAATRRVIESGWYVLGKEVEAFEKQWAEICGTQHAVGVGNGMDAIEITLRALDIGTGDEVITTPMTAFATVLAILRAGASPVLADIDSESGLLSPESVKRCLTSRTRAVLLVHLYGQMRQMDVWTKLCQDAGIELIEDCAQSHLASWGGRSAGSWGKAGAYSFYPTKNLGSIGDAGAIVTNSGEMAHRMRRLRNYGQSERYLHPEIGMNSRLDELQAAILSEKLNWLEKFTARRREISNHYDAEIRHGSIKLLASPESAEAHVHHLYVVLSESRESLSKHLAECGVQSLIHYPIPVHKQSACKSLPRDPEGLACVERHADNCLSLPCHPMMSDEEVAQVVDAVNSFE